MLSSFGSAVVLTLVVCGAWGSALARPAVRPAEAVDRFGVKMLFPTASSGREWFADWADAREIGPGQFDPRDPLLRNSEGTVRVADGVARITPGQTRLYVMTPKGAEGRYAAPLWQNVEMTVYARRGEATQTPSYQAFDLSARSGERHNDREPCDGTSYHGTLRFDGQCGFKKEIWHTGGYTDLAPKPAPRPWPTVPVGKWVGLKLVCRNLNQNRNVELRLYTDPEDRNDWRPVAEYTDRGGWLGGRESCGRPRDYIITEGRPAVYFRTDHVAVDVRKFSVREIDPLP